jgi:sugar phosphate isomerase/epimerase
VTKIGFSLQPQYGLPVERIMELLAQAGFSAVSPVWTTEEHLESIAACAAANGMGIQSVHAPLTGIPQLWEPETDASKQAQAEILHCVEACEKYHVPVMVLHSWQGLEYTFPKEPLDFRFFDTLVAVTKRKGLSVALENLEGEEYLAALLERYADQTHIGFCWDSGHEMCYSHSEDLLAKLGDRLIMTHLNDNLGVSRFDGKTYWTDDLHLLPYDGIADWDVLIQRLRKSKKLEILNFELNIPSKPNRHENDVYAQMPLEQYFAEAYKRACRIAFRYAK